MDPSQLHFSTLQIRIVLSDIALRHVFMGRGRCVGQSACRACSQAVLEEARLSFRFFHPPTSYNDDFCSRQRRRSTSSVSSI